MQHPKRVATALAFATFVPAASSHAASNVPEPAVTPSAAVVSMSAPKAPGEPLERELDWSKIPQEDARELLRRAFAAERAGKLDLARAAIEEAHHLVKSAAIELELGLVHLRTGHPDLALRFMERGMTLFPNEALPRPAAYYARKMEEAKRRVAALYVFVEQPHAKLFVDGKPVVDWPFVDHVYVLPGIHKLTAEKTGFVRGSEEIQVSAGERRDVVLEPRERPMRQVQIGALTAPFSLDTDEPPWTWQTKLAVGGAIGFVVSATALTVGLVTWSSAGEDEVAKTNVAKGVTLAAGICTGLSLVGTTAGLASMSTPPRPPPGPIVIYVQTSSSGAGMALRGSF